MWSPRTVKTLRPLIRPRAFSKAQVQAEALLTELQARTRGFPVLAANVQPLRRPHDFWNTVSALVQGARRRISIAALYLGTGEHERRLLAAVEHVLQTRPEVHVEFVFDGRRARRASGSASTVSLLAPLLVRHPQRARLGLLTLPAAQRASSLPSPLDEIAGVFHAKAVVVDNDAVLTGANLSRDYFVNRQDRYVRFANVPELAAWYHDLVAAFARCGERVEVDATGLRTSPPSLPAVDQWRELWLGLLRPRPAPLPSSCDTWVFPTLQCGPAGVRQDTEVLATVLLQCPDAAAVRLASAYLNPKLGGLAERLAMHRLGSVEVLTADARSHGFKGAKGLMGCIPACYAHLNDCFVAHLAARRPEAPLWALRLFHRHEWTFHAKGLWMWWPDDGNGECHGDGGCLSVVGSSNYGLRSEDLDVEAQLVVLTRDPALGAALRGEWAWLRQFSHVHADQSKPTTNDPAPWWARVLAAVLRRLM